MRCRPAAACGQTVFGWLSAFVAVGAAIVVTGGFYGVKMKAR